MTKRDILITLLAALCGLAIVATFSMAFAEKYKFLAPGAGPLVAGLDDSDSGSATRTRSRRADHHADSDKQSSAQSYDEQTGTQGIGVERLATKTPKMSKTEHVPAQHSGPQGPSSEGQEGDEGESESERRHYPPVDVVPPIVSRRASGLRVIPWTDAHDNAPSQPSAGMPVTVPPLIFGMPSVQSQPAEPQPAVPAASADDETTLNPPANFLFHNWH